MIYDIIEIGILQGYKTEARDVNKWGHVVGVLSSVNGETPDAAFSWSQFYGLHKLPDLGDKAEARAINDSGTIAGAASSPNAAIQAVIWDPLQNIQQLPVPANATESFTHDICESGISVGGYIEPGPKEHPLRWKNIANQPEEPVVPGLWSEALSVNVYGYAVGPTDNGGFLWPYNGQAVAVGGSPAAINDFGEIVGNWGNHAAILTGGNAITIPELPGCVSGMATALNAHGNAVGDCFDFAQQSHAFLYQPWKGAPESLNSLVDPTLGWTLEHATAINDSDEITGFGTHNGQPRSFLMIPKKASSDSRAFITALVTQIIYGGRLGNRGIAIGPHGPEPIPPRGPEIVASYRSVLLRDLWTHLSMAEMAGSLSNEEEARSLQKRALKELQNEITTILRSLDK